MVAVAQYVQMASWPQLAVMHDWKLEIIIVLAKMYYSILAYSTFIENNMIYLNLYIDKSDHISNLMKLSRLTIHFLPSYFSLTPPVCNVIIIFLARTYLHLYLASSVRVIVNLLFLYLIKLLL